MTKASSIFSPPSPTAEMGHAAGKKHGSAPVPCCLNSPNRDLPDGNRGHIKATTSLPKEENQLKNMNFKTIFVFEAKLLDKENEQE